MLVLQELTEWSDSTPNHVYFVNDERSKMLGYIRAGTKAVIKFSKPLGFDTRKRKFKEIKNTWGFVEDKPQNPQWRFEGSKGNTYVVEQTENGLVCTCPGFVFRGKCKHVAAVENGEV